MPAKAGAQDKLPFGQAGGHHRQSKFDRREMDSRLRGNDEMFWTSEPPRHSESDRTAIFGKMLAL
jgi:hypothetical protein